MKFNITDVDICFVLCLFFVNALGVCPPRDPCGRLVRLLTNPADKIADTNDCDCRRKNGAGSREKSAGKQALNESFQCSIL